VLPCTSKATPGKGIAQPALNQADRQVGDVDADPSAAEFWAACVAIPHPAKASRQTSPGLLLAGMAHAQSTHAPPADRTHSAAALPGQNPMEGGGG
jgi:hypothetical protein